MQVTTSSLIEAKYSINRKQVRVMLSLGGSVHMYVHTCVEIYIKTYRMDANFNRVKFFVDLVGLLIHKEAKFIYIPCSV